MEGGNGGGYRGSLGLYCVLWVAGRLAYTKDMYEIGNFGGPSRVVIWCLSMKRLVNRK